MGFEMCLARGIIPNRSQSLSRNARCTGVIETGETVLLLNINARTREQFVSYRDEKGAWQAKGTIRFPIRACYPQVALQNHAAHVLAIGDIVEPVELWKTLKYEKLRRDWDYVFRRLFYTWTPDIQQTRFCPPVEIDTVEETCGYILNLDLYVDAST